MSGRIEEFGLIKEQGNKWSKNSKFQIRKTGVDIGEDPKSAPSEQEYIEVVADGNTKYVDIFHGFVIDPSKFTERSYITIDNGYGYTEVYNLQSFTRVEQASNWGNVYLNTNLGTANNLNIDIKEINLEINRPLNRIDLNLIIRYSMGNNSPNNPPTTGATCVVGGLVNFNMAQSKPVAGTKIRIYF